MNQKFPTKMNIKKAPKSGAHPVASINLATEALEGGSLLMPPVSSLMSQEGRQKIKSTGKWGLPHLLQFR